MIGFVLAGGILPFLICWGISYSLKRRITSSTRHGRPGGPQLVSLQCSLILASALLGAIIAGYLWGRPIFGLVLGAIPSLCGERASSLWLFQRNHRKVEEASVGFLTALQGLLKSGIGLSSALFQLVESPQSTWAPFAGLLDASLIRFHSGTSLSACLTRARDRTSLPGLRLGLGLVQMAYCQGLPILPILGRTLEWLERDLAARARIRDLARAAWAQLAIAVSLPWIVFTTLAYFEPGLWRHFRESTQFWPVVALALSLEIVGAYSIRRCACFC